MSRWVRFIGFTISVLLLLLFLSSWHYFLYSPATALILFSVSCICNYILTFGVTVHLFQSQQKSNLFINLYLFIFIVLPFISTLCYFLVGTISISKNTINNYKKQLQKYQQYETYNISQILLQTMNYCVPYKIFLYNYTEHNRRIVNAQDIQILQTSEQHIEALINLIKKAKKFIHMEYYIFADGFIVDYLLILFEEQIKKGVEIRLIIDDWGNYWCLKKHTRKKLETIGVQLKLFNPILKSNNFWWQLRNHNKILIVDNEEAIYGSCNISDEYFGITSHYFQTTELSMILKGHIVNSLSVLFYIHWNMYKNKNKEFDILLQQNNYFETFLPQKEIITSQNIMQLINSSPLTEDKVIKNNLIQLINEAKKTIIISTPYFFPPKDIVNALKMASVSGVKIKILVPKQADFKNFFLHIHRQLFYELLNVNIEIYEYFGFNHEKICIIDDDVAYFGSYNWDYRALYLNFESALLLKNKECIDGLRSFMKRQFDNSHLVKISEIEISKKFFVYFINGFIRLFKPFL